MASADARDGGDGDREFVRAAMRQPYLERERERELARRWRDRGDEAALHELVSAYVRLVVGIAGRFRGYGLPLGDLVQEGNVGLLQAAARFEPDRNLRFSTYARWYVRSAIQDFVLRNWSIVRTGTTAAQKAMFFNLRRAYARIDAIGGHVPAQARERVARAFGVDSGLVEAMEQRLFTADKSLNAGLAEDSSTEWQDLVADDAPSPEEQVVEASDLRHRRGLLKRALSLLTPRERMIVRARRLEEERRTLAALGRELGISKERVRQIENEALDKLRAMLSGQLGDGRRAEFAPS